MIDFERPLAELLEEHGACADAVAWAQDYRTAAAAWEACQRSDWMLWALDQIGYSDEKLRLFACWCARNTLLSDGRKVWDLLSDQRSKHAVEVAERFARGQATKTELDAASSAAWSAADAASSAADEAWSAVRSAAWSAAWSAADAASSAAWSAADAARSAARSAVRSAADAAWSAASSAARSAAWSAASSAARSAAWSAARSAAWSAAWSAQADALRRIVGNPFRVKRRRKEG